MLRENIRKTLGYVPLSVREEIEEVLRSADVDCSKLDARFECTEGIQCFVVYNDAQTQEKAEKLYSEIKKITSVTMKTVKETENNG